MSNETCLVEVNPRVFVCTPCDTLWVALVAKGEPSTCKGCGVSYKEQGGHFDLRGSEPADDEEETVCPVCLGTGDDNGNHERNWSVCGTCNGSGYVRADLRASDGNETDPAKVPDGGRK